ncbi:MAG: hypothetical protein JSW66_16845 [Phycisphaerales bacterium]|nr:MAG: hypothetical protein JSW66_16845 [Phycisphaerales bacterium]
MLEELFFIRVVDAMAEQDLCPTCIQKHDCQKVYRELGSSRGPSVAVKVSLAFLLPLVVFIVTLAVFQKIFAEEAEPVKTAFGLAMALVSTLACILVVRAISRRPGRDR